MTYSEVAKRLRLPLGFLFGIAYLVFARPTPLTLAVGGAIALIGVVVRAWASGHISKNERLATSGPYAHTRNPLYFGSFLIAAGFAFLMLDLGELAIVTGWTVVALWAYGTLAGPRPTAVLTFVYGAGLFVTTFWWPREGWWLGAIALMWVGVGLIAIALLGIVASRARSTSGKRAYKP